MRSKRIHNRAEHALPIVWAAFACADVASEAMRRMVGAPAVDAGTRIGGTFVDMGRRIMQRMRAMLSADEVYHQLRARQRRRQARRDDLAQRLYRQLGQARPRLRCLVKDEVIRHRLEKLGPTRRRPWLLCRQASEILELLRLRVQDNEMPVFTQVIEDIEASLCISLSELDQALDQVGRGRFEVASAMLDQRKAMQRFDRAATRGGQLLEAQLILIGLPTLGDAVRPQIGRRGRPLKQRPVDLHPDLVEQVRVVGMIRLDDRELGSGSSTETADAGRIGIETTSRVENTGGWRVLTHPKSANDGSLVSEKIEHLFTELAQDLEKIEYTLSEPLEGLEIIETPLPELQIDGRKSGHRFPELPRSGVSDFCSTLRVPPAVILPRRRQRRRPNTAGRRACDVLSQTGATASSPSKLGRVRRAASDWWEKLRPVA